MKRKALIIEDSKFMVEIIKNCLEKIDFEVVGVAEDGDSGIEMALEHEPDLITLDNILPDMIGIEIAKVLMIEEQMDTKIIMISAVGNDDMIADAKASGVHAYMTKPFNEELLIETVNSVMG